MAQDPQQKLQQTPGILHPNACVIIVKTEWNSAIVDQLEAGCLQALGEAGVKEPVSIVAPGAFEIPFVIKNYWEALKYGDRRPTAFVALGCVLRGDTPHFDYVCRAVTDGVLQLNLSLPVPVIFGVLTVDNQQQADDRTGGIHGNKGHEAGVTAVKMIALQQSFSRTK